MQLLSLTVKWENRKYIIPRCFISMVTAQSMAHMNCVVYLLSSVNPEYENCAPNSFFFLSLEGSRPECCYFWALPLGKEKKVAKENVSFFFFFF